MYRIVSLFYSSSVRIKYSQTIYRVGAERMLKRA